MANGDWSRIQHIVVMMLENRSFDNLLGWLYDPSNPAPFNQAPPANFEGLHGKSLSNPKPDGTLVSVGKGQVLTDPTPDPGEPFEDVYCQIYGQKAAPNPIPPKPTTPANMQGFIYNYAVQKDVVSQKIDSTKIMNCFTPASVPVLSSLAYYYCVCDHWFSSIPSQTICNRPFVRSRRHFLRIREQRRRRQPDFCEQYEDDLRLAGTKEKKLENLFGKLAHHQPGAADARECLAVFPARQPRPFRTS